MAVSIADDNSCGRSRRWLRTDWVERVVVASQKLGAEQMGWTDAIEANGRRTRGRLARGERYSDSAARDQCVCRSV